MNTQKKRLNGFAGPLLLSCNKIPFRPVFKICGICLLVSMLLYWLYFDPFAYAPPLFLGTAVSVSCAVFSWLLISGAALTKHPPFKLQSRKRSVGLILTHSLLFLCTAVAFLIIRQELSEPGAVFQQTLLNPARVGVTLNLVFAAANTAALLIFLFSVINTVRESVLHFTLCCHSLLFMAFVYFTRAQLYSLADTRAVIKNLDQGLPFYVGTLLVYTAAFLFFRMRFKMKSAANERTAL